MGAHGAEISIKISAMAEVEPRTAHPLLLVASYDMQEDTVGKVKLPHRR